MSETPEEKIERMLSEVENIGFVPGGTVPYTIELTEEDHRRARFIFGMLIGCELIPLNKTDTAYQIAMNLRTELGL